MTDSRRDEKGLPDLRDPAAGRVMLHPLLEAAFRGLDRASVSWCLLRVPSNPAAPTGDVDLLIKETDQEHAARALEMLGFARLPVWGAPHAPETFYLGYHSQTDHHIYLHVVAELSFGPNRALLTPPGAMTEFLKRTRRRGSMVLPDLDDAFWTLLLHCLLDKGTVEPRYRAGLQTLARAVKTPQASPSEMVSAIEAACLKLSGEDSWDDPWDAARLLACARRASPVDWATLERIAPQLVKAWPRRQSLTRGRALSVRGSWLAARLLGLLRYSTYRRYARRRVSDALFTRRVRESRRGRASRIGADVMRHVALAIKRICLSRTIRVLLGSLRSTPRENAAPRLPDKPGVSERQQRGLAVALLGPDGVGKTTLAAGLEGSSAGFAGVHTLYMGLGYAGLPRLARLPIPGSRASVGLLTLWWRSAAARYYKRRGRLVIFDRYTHDALLPPGRHLSWSERLARQVWARACPAPDLALLLDAPGEAVLDRRGEGDPALLEHARRDYLSLARRSPKLQVVNAARPEEAVLRDVVERLRRHALHENEEGLR